MATTRVSGTSRRRLVVAPLVAAAVAVLVGAGVGVAAGATWYALTDPASGFADLAAILVGLLAAVGAFVTTWVVGLVLAVRSALPPGRRLRAALLAVGLSVVLGVGAALLAFGPLAEAMIPVAGPLGGAVGGFVAQVLLVVAAVATGGVAALLVSGRRP